MKQLKIIIYSHLYIYIVGTLLNQFNNLSVKDKFDMVNDQIVSLSEDFRIATPPTSGKKNSLSLITLSSHLLLYINRRRA